ncbi:MAG: hypothetical protein GC193_12740 [Cryomorphaceae bacterium]|nr:hypothetical protein [Cryomorphaceae bacterium]
MNITWNRLFGSLLLFVFFALLGGCGKGYDETPPAVSGVNVSANEIVPTVAGGIVSIEMAFSDDQELNQAIMMVKPADDLDGFFSWTEGDWNAFKLVELNGDNTSQTFTLLAPDSARGKHLVSINAIDARGNESETFEFFIDVQNGLLPYIDVSSINGQSALPIQLQAGQPLEMQGMINGGGIFSSYIVSVNDSAVISADPSSSMVGLDFYPATVPSEMSGTGILSIYVSNGSTASTRTFAIIID